MSPKTLIPNSPIHGWLNINKPLGVTSTKVVSIVRKVLGIKKVGHAGTLDPLAEGVLPLAIGEATKTVNYIMDHTKTYHFEITWGAQTSTDDLEGEILETSPHRPTVEQIKAALDEFIGTINQIPPKYSALKVNGERAYKLARQNKPVKLAPREIVIHDFQLIELKNTDQATFQVVCGKGTYVRSLARDLARRLGTYGHVSWLQRRQVGKFDLNRSISLEKIEELGHKVLSEGFVIPISQVLDDIPALWLSEVQQIRLSHGQTIQLTSAQANGLTSRQVVLCLREDQQVLAIGTQDQGFVKPDRVFNI